jgi:adenylate kinase
MNLVFLGPPGSGKGTQAARLSAEHGLVHLSTGDMLREAVKKGTMLGKRAEAYMVKGELVPDELIIGLIEDKISGGELNGGFILDGFPRTIPQAESLKQMLAKHSLRLDSAVLYCPVCKAGYNYPAQMPRNAGKCDNDGNDLLRRPDDEEPVVRRRLEVYRHQTEPIVDYYRSESVLTEIKGDGSPDAVYQELLKSVH